MRSEYLKQISVTILELFNTNQFATTWKKVETNQVDLSNGGTESTSFYFVRDWIVKEKALVEIVQA